MRTFAPCLAAVAGLALAVAVALGGEGGPYAPTAAPFAADRCPPWWQGPPVPTWPGSGVPAAPGTPYTPGQPSVSGTTPGSQGQAQGQANQGQAGQAQTPQGQDQANANNLGQSDFGQAPGAGTGSGGSAAPAMMGDFLRGFIERDIVIFQQAVTTNTFLASQGYSQSRVLHVLVPIGGASAYKIAENESPRPQDRVFLGYNGYANLAPEVNHRFGVSPDLHQATIGFEKTFFGGDASFGIRAPFYSLGDTGGGDVSGFGALTLTTKFAFLNDRDGGTVVSGGLLVTLPTGRNVDDGFGHKINPVVFTPWLGYLAGSGEDFYTHGYLSVALPTERSDATIFFADFGVGYNLFRGPGFAVIPSSEIHVNLPLTHRGLEGTDTLVQVPSSIVLTELLIFRLGERLDVQTGVALPVTGNKPYNWEGIAQVNFRF